MKFVLAGYGSRGDVEPFAAIGRELLGRGHDVCLAVRTGCSASSSRRGLPRVCFGSDAQPITEMSDVVRRIIQILAEWGAGLKTLASRADLLLTGKGEQGDGRQRRGVLRDPNAALHFYPGDDASLGGVIGALGEAG